MVGVFQRVELTPHISREMHNLPAGYIECFRRGEGGREKTLASADHVRFL